MIYINLLESGLLIKNYQTFCLRKVKNKQNDIVSGLNKRTAGLVLKNRRVGLGICTSFSGVV